MGVITFTKLPQGAIQVNYPPDVEGVDDIDTIAPRVAGALFADTAVPKVGDVVMFAGPTDAWLPGIKRTGQDVPRSVSYDGVTYVFSVSNGVAMYTVLSVGADETVTVQRGWT